MTTLSTPQNPCLTLPCASEMMRLDSLHTEHIGITSTQLMFNAASAAFDAIINECERPQNVLIFCGGGGNGGDGYVLAQLFEALSCNVFVCNLADEIRSPDTRYYRDTALDKTLIKDISPDRLTQSVFGYDIIIDAVFGVGFHGELRGDVIAMFEFAKNSDAFKVAIDLPSGVYCDDARVTKGSFCADLTVTFEFYKPCHVSYPAKEFCGEVKVVSIGYQDAVLDKATSDGVLLSGEILLYLNKKIPPQAHKGTLGKMLSVTGSKNMTGAVYLSSVAALRGGIGLLYIACERDILNVLQQKLNEPVFMPYDDDFVDAVGDLSRFDVVLHGCGSGTARAEITHYLIKNYTKTLVLDADALNNITDNNIFAEKKSQLIITPHPLEMARLCNKTVEEVGANRIAIARDFAKEHDCIVVLKGAASVIASPNGQFAINPTGNPGMAKGGSGDILSGLVSAYCMGSDDLFKAVSAAVYMHGMIGDACAKDMSWRSMIPTDILNYIHL